MQFALVDSNNLVQKLLSNAEAQSLLAKPPNGFTVQLVQNWVTNTDSTKQSIHTPKPSAWKGQ